MAERSNVALIALRAAPGVHTKEPQAVVIGTLPAWDQSADRRWRLGQDWRYICYPLSELRYRIARRADLLAPPSPPVPAGYWASIDLVEDAVAGGSSLAPIERQALNGFVSSSYLAKKLTLTGTDGRPFQCSRLDTAVVLRDVERIFFFSFTAGAGRDDSRSWLEPFAAFDTARFADRTASSLSPEPFGSKPRKYLGSRLVLFPDFAAADRRGALSGLTIHLGIKAAVNGHFFRDTDQQADRYDTRFFLDMGVVQPSPTVNMWFPLKAPVGSDNALPHPSRGAQFDAIRLRFSTAPWSSAATSRSPAATRAHCDLFNFALQDPEPSSVTDLRTSRLPVLDALGVAQGGSFLTSRKLGFRVVDAVDAVAGKTVPTKIAWRFEHTLRTDLSKLTRSRAVEAIIPTSIANVLDDGSLTLIQEQRIEDIAIGALEVGRPARTILTIRTQGTGQNQALSDAVLSAINEVSDGVHRGLKLVRDGRPLSLLPRLSGNKPAVPWHLVGIIVDRSPGWRTLVPPAAKRAPELSAQLLSFEPQIVDNPWIAKDLEAIGPIRADAVLPRLISATRTTPQYPVELFAPRVASAFDVAAKPSCNRPAYQPAVVVGDEPESSPRGTRLGIHFRTSDPTPALATSPPSPPSPPEPPFLIGAFQVELAKRATKSAPPPGDALANVDATVGRHGYLLLRNLGAESDGDIGKSSSPTAGLSAVLRLPVTNVSPAGEDDPDGAERVGPLERRRPPLEPTLPDRGAPLLLPLGKAKTEGKLHLLLTSEEAVVRDRDHTIALSLRAGRETAQIDENPAAQRLLILQPQPFRIAAIDYEPIVRKASDESSEVAVWNHEGEGGLSWRVRDDVQSVSLFFPPQVIGEAMEKYRSGVAGLPTDIRPSTAAAARFGSLTALRVDPTYADTRFHEPGWNLRRMLGSALQRSPGVRLLDLRLELLYGMLTRVRADDVWMTEIAGSIGAPPLPLDAVPPTPYAARHARLIEAALRSERSRLTVDTLWRGKPDGDLRLDDGVSFLVRRRLVDRVGGKDVLRSGPRTKLRWPLPSDMPKDTGSLIDQDVLKATFAQDDDDLQAFPGGLSWAFPSANVLMSVYGRPRSDGGSVRGVRLTSLGGYGMQRALFDQRKSVVETETTQGRVQRYRLERIGRIACLWHRAKHVIVYERTVVPAAQFYNLPPIGLLQDEHLGRAVLRKVEEYVEILTPVRRYPEDGTSVQACGFVVGAEFKSKKIRVDSSWGSDVRREGWQVPLWSRTFEGLTKPPAPPAPEGSGTPPAAGPEDVNPDDPANLYPKPHIHVLLAGEGGAEVSYEIDEPEKVFFYTSVIKGEDDNTDLWQPVRDVDFCDLPYPVVGSVKNETADLTDATLPPEPEHVPGYERFTLGLVPGKKAVALTHGRIEGGPVAALRNLTVARSSLPAASTAPSSTALAKDFGRRLSADTADLRGEIDKQVGRVLGVIEQLDRNTDPATLKLAARDLAKKAADAFEDTGIGKKLKEIQDAKPTTHLPLGNACERLTAQITTAVDAQWLRLRDVVHTAVEDSTAAATEGISAPLRVVRDEIGTRLGELAAGVGEIGALAQMALDALAAAEKLPLEQRRLALEAVKKASADLGDQIDRAKTDADAEIHRRAEAAKALLKRLRSLFDSALDVFEDRVVRDVGVVRTLVGAEVKEDFEKLREALSAVKEAQAAAISGAMSLLNRLVAAGDQIDQACKDAATPAIAKIDRALSLIGDIQRKAGAKGADAQAMIGPICQVLARALFVAKRIAVLVQASSVGSAAALFRTDLAAIQADLETGLESLTTWVERLLTGSETALAKAIAQAIPQIESAVRMPFNTLRKAGSALADTADVLEKLSDIEGKVVSFVDASAKQMQTAREGLAAKIDHALDQASKPITDVLVQLRVLQTLIQDASKAIGEYQKGLDGLAADLKNAIDELTARLVDSVKTFAGEIETIWSQCETTIHIGRKTLTAALSEQCAKIDALLAKALDNIEDYLKNVLDCDGLKRDIEGQIGKILENATTTVADVKAQVAAAAARLAREAEGRGRAILGSLQQSVRDAAGMDLNEVGARALGVYQSGDRALRAVRALGEPPKTDSLGFNRPQVAYVLQQGAKLGVDMTPALALVNRAADQVAAVENAGKAVGELLDSFGVRLPMREITDQLVPDGLKGLSIASLLPDMAGVDLRGLMQGVGFPDLDASNAVKIRHGVDQKTLRAWMEADLDVPFSQSAPLLRFGPVEIVIDSARLASQARLSAGRDGVERKMNGRIFGDWRIVCSGQTILTFRQTGLYFDDSGKIDFRIQPEKIVLAEALRFITDLMRATGQKGGLRIEPFMRGGVPTGVAAVLDMVLPPIQSGAFGISDLSLHVLFGIAAVPQFEIVSELSVASRVAPFTLNVWILNGGGYLTQRLSYLPMAKPQPLLTYTLEVGIVAGLGLGFSFGVVSGGVWLQVGCSIALSWRTGPGGNTTAMRVFLLARGNVDVAGLITASITLLFEVSYDGQRMIGAGTLSVRVKISVFFTLSVRQHVEYVFTGKKQDSTQGSYSDAYC